MKQFGDGVFLPLETPEARQHLQEMCEGKLIARCYWNVAGRQGPRGFGLEFTTSERLVVVAIPTRGRCLARLIWRWVPAQDQWSPGMRRRLRSDRHAVGEDAPDALQAKIEGQMLRGVRPATVSNFGLGEVMDFELRDGAVLRVEALPVMDVRPHEADMRIRRVAPGHQAISLGKQR